MGLLRFRQDLLGLSFGKERVVCGLELGLLDFGIFLDKALGFLEGGL